MSAAAHAVGIPTGQAAEDVGMVHTEALERAAADAERKRFSGRAATAAIAGWQLWRSDAADGPQRYFAGRRGRVRVLTDLDEVDQFLKLVGAPA